MSAASAGALVREAVAAALVCLEPVLARRAMPANRSPTLEIIFNAQLEAWMARRDARALKLAEALGGPRMTTSSGESEQLSTRR